MYIIPNGYIRLNRRDVIIMENPATFELGIKLMSEEALDNIIEQCRDIKLKLLEEKKNEH